MKNRYILIYSENIETDEFYVSVISIGFTEHWISLIIKIFLVYDLLCDFLNKNGSQLYL